MTKGRASIEAYSFLKYAISKSINQPNILIDGYPWHKPAYQHLGVDWEYIIFGLHNPIEQWFFQLKQWIKQFYRNWPYNTKVGTVQNWLNFFVRIYHFKRC